MLEKDGRKRAMKLTRWEEQRREFFRDRRIRRGRNVEYEELEKIDREKQVIDYGRG